VAGLCPHATLNKVRRVTLFHNLMPGRPLSHGGRGGIAKGIAFIRRTSPKKGTNAPDSKKDARFKSESARV